MALMSNDVAQSDDVEKQRFPNAEDEARMCRICLDGGGSDLIAPCRCSGTSKWVHRECLNRWRVAGLNARAFTHCRECEGAYFFVSKFGLHDIRRQQCFIVSLLLRNFVLGLLAIQSWLCLVALFCRLADPSMHLVTVFNFKQDGLTATEGVSPGALWDSLQHHKTTYYSCSILVNLVLVGFIGFIYMCCSWCRNDVSSSRRRDCCDDCFNSCAYSNFYFYSPGSLNICKCDNCKCDNCSGGGGDDCGGFVVICVVIAAAIVLFFLVLGIFFILIMAVLAVQRFARRLVQVRQLKVLATEYEVQDLSSMPFSQTPVSISIPTVIGHIVEPEPSRPSQKELHLEPFTDPIVQRALTKDLYHIWGK